MATISTNAARINLPDRSKKVSPAGAPQLLDFTLQDSYSISLLIFQQQGNIGGVQTAFIDNTDSTGNLVLTFPGSGQRIVFPAKSAGYIPVIAPNPILYIATIASGGASNVQVTLLNYEVPSIVWTVS